MEITFQQKLNTPFSWLIIPLQVGGLSRALSEIGQHFELDHTAVEQDFKAEAGETAVIYSKQGRLLLLGLGQKPSFSESLQAFRGLSYDFKDKWSEQIAVHWTLSNLKPNQLALHEGAANGLALGTYSIGRFKSKSVELHPLAKPNAQIVWIVEEAHHSALAKVTKAGLLIAHTQMEMMDLVNAPSNHKLPTDIAAKTQKSGEEFNYDVKVLTGQACEKENLHALMAVNRGSEAPATFIIGHYKPKQSGTKKVALIGKGVTFDTGGLSIKPSTNMHMMKSDMGGAAAVLGTLEVAARLQLPVELVAIVGATDNSVDAKSIKPSDVIQSFSGKTIEIIDTDAEGRLVLADGLAYAEKHFKPDVMIDVATLTGSAVRTFGYAAGALFTNDDELAADLQDTGMDYGEKVWRLPIWDDYKDDISSDVADVRNFSGKPVAGAISAAKFLEVFTNEHPRWAHLDIAGVAFTDSKFAKSRSATGFGIRLLVEYLRKISG